MQVIDDRCEQDLIFPGAADARYPQQRILMTLLEGAFGVPYGLSPQIVRRQQGRFLVFNVQIDRLRRPALDAAPVPARRFQLRTESPPRLPAGTQSGTTFRLKGRGIRDVQGHGQGDLLVRVTVEVPTNLNATQRQKLEEFAKSCGTDVNPRSRSFFERARDFFN